MEGPDNSGKSTLVKWLAEQAQADVVHSARPGPTEDLKERIRYAFRCDQEVKAGTRRTVVFDRISFVSEHVYGRLLRSGCLLCKDGIEPFHIEAFRARGGSFVYCRPPDSIIKDMSTHDAKPYETAEHVAKVIDHAVAIAHAYDDRMAEMWEQGIPVLTYDWTAAAPAEILRSRILKRLLNGVF